MVMAFDRKESHDALTIDARSEQLCLRRQKVTPETKRWTKSKRLERWGDRGMEVTTGKRARGGFNITHMLHWIIRSFVKWTMGTRGTGLKKDTHTVKASSPGEQPANPEVSEKTWNYTEHVFTILSGIYYFLRDFKENQLKTCFF